jgi:peptidyl-prolyl cis-trans isomerase C
MLHRLVIAISVSFMLNACDNGELIGEINGRDITRAEFNRYLAHKNIPQQDAKRVELVLKDYMQREAYTEVVESSEDFDSKQIEVEVNEFRKQLIISRHFEKHLNNVVSEEAIKNYYNTHAGEFQREKIKVAHVLIRTNSNMSEAELQSALTRAQEAYSRARTDVQFADIASQYSEDTVSAKQGGELGWLGKGAIDPVFSAKVFAAQVGEITEPFRSAFGFHIVKVLEEAKLIKVSFDKVKGDIRYRLRQQAKQAEMDRMLSASEINYL